MSKVPNRNKPIIVPEKIKNYILSPTHPVGRFKAVYFKKFGYTADKWELFAKELKFILSNNDIVKITKTEYGVKYEVAGVITGINNKNSIIVTVWIIVNNEQYPRFITAYPGDKI